MIYTLQQGVKLMRPSFSIISGFGQWVQDVRSYSDNHPLVRVVVAQFTQNKNGVPFMSTTKVVDAEALASLLAGKEEVEVEVGHGSTKAVINLQRVVDGKTTLMGVALPTSTLTGDKLRAGARYKVVASGDMIQTLAPKAAVKPQSSNGCTAREAMIMGARAGKA